jgi:hypothetical protein
MQNKGREQLCIYFFDMDDLIFNKFQYKPVWVSIVDAVAKQTVLDGGGGHTTTCSANYSRTGSQTF